MQIHLQRSTLYIYLCQPTVAIIPSARLTSDFIALAISPIRKRRIAPQGAPCPPEA
ncbi:MAG: hypothetical protein SNH73_02765 [Rikenellaceae bacterium]